jgi:hypothetical protein
MKRKAFWWMAQISLFVVAASLGALGQTQLSFRGTINDYAPANVSPTGPWLVGGDWTLVVNGTSGKADFKASLTMVRSDYWVSLHGDPNDPSGRTPHSHDIALLNGTVTPIAGGFRVSGMASVAASGNVPPFGQMSPLTVDITGGTAVPFSNIKVTFGSPASGHFGTQPLDGVVQSFK